MIVILTGKVIITRPSTVGDVLVFPVEPGYVQDITVVGDFKLFEVSAEEVWLGQATLDPAGGSAGIVGQGAALVADASSSATIGGGGTATL